jgi:two-component system, OmpR family, sensor kinase
VRRFSIRVRLTLAFAITMAIVLGALGAFLYVRVEGTLMEQFNDSLRQRSETLVNLVKNRGRDVTAAEVALADDEEGVAQVLEPDGTIVASSKSVRNQMLVDAADLARTRNDRRFFVRREIQGFAGGDVKVLVRRFDARGGPLVLAVGAPLDDVRDSLAGLLAHLLLIAPFALLLSSAAGYLLARAALRPVDEMRERAAQVSSERPGRRLPLPEAKDEIYRLGQTLNEMLGRLEAGIARERRFLAAASHELRTPLALLKTELELALRRPRTREELEHAVASTADEVERLARLAEDLLVLARLEEGRLPLRRSELDVGELLRTVARRFASRAAEAQRGLGVSVPDDMTVVGDRLRLEQALGNLVDNALRHGAGAVALSASRRNGSVEVRVSDEGGGFPADFVPRAFDPLTRADEARRGRSPGLGLAIVAAVAGAHDGSVNISSENGSNVVTLVLPASTATVEEPPLRGSSTAAL